MPQRELLIAAGPGEWRAVLLEDEVAVELHVQRGEGAETGSIHLGRVVKKLPALAALLVDIGGVRPVFLSEREIVPRGRVPDEGEPVVLQVRREAQGGKAARATMQLSPRPDPAAAALIRDRARALVPPVRLHPPATFAAALAGALPAMPAAVAVDDPAAAPEIRAAFPDTPFAVRRHAEWPVDLDALFAEALARSVVLAGGGSLHIEMAQAAVLIDVDSGSPPSGTPAQVRLATDLAAAEAIARHLRLRNLGGGIVVDFVGLDSVGAREQVRAALAKAVAGDPARPYILGWTRLGHLELMRPRSGRPLADALCEPAADGGLVKTAATVAHEALRAVQRAARAEPGRRWEIAVAAEVAALLSDGLAGARRALEARLAHGLRVTVEPARGRDRFDIAAR